MGCSSETILGLLNLHWILTKKQLTKAKKAFIVWNTAFLDLIFTLGKS